MSTQPEAPSGFLIAATLSSASVAAFAVTQGPSWGWLAIALAAAVIALLTIAAWHEE